MEVRIDGKEYIEKGDWNSGDRNSGYWNSGYWNSGDGNSGDGNSGDRNSGYGNSGYWNSGDWNSGYLNTDRPKIRFFNKETELTDLRKVQFPDYFYFDLTEFVNTENMTEAEKKKYPHYKTTKGFLRVFDYKEAWKRSFKKATKEDVALTLKLPNFDYKIFEKISGITRKMIKNKLKEADKG